ncbi:hypothetical protein PFISCL1PPCAC_5355 [Pristionchus fissidentatus]|uniref:MARVEL domain-containing protein n=1 Tax=Pristionchus fissidentatus TaxID=1538716 RepID=A0AAV5V4K7_9BILA|nr:hypothetical protein PFISCL1PPCAC_5355 [Pristionchus fissidentatus]
MSIPLEDYTYRHSLCCGAHVKTAAWGFVIFQIIATVAFFWLTILSVGAIAIFFLFIMGLVIAIFVDAVGNERSCSIVLAIVVMAVEVIQRIYTGLYVLMFSSASTSQHSPAMIIFGYFLSASIWIYAITIFVNLYAYVNRRPERIVAAPVVRVVQTTQKYPIVRPAPRSPSAPPMEKPTAPMFVEAAVEPPPQYSP